jgi:uncharacterized membrane protein YeaQ/YmgE (transglycosylase-associated protein family)
MTVVILVVIMIVVGLVVGALAGLIWREERPLGVPGDYVVAVVATVATGLLDWYVIPAMGFSDIWKWLGVAIEPPIVALIVLWLIAKARQ